MAKKDTWPPNGERRREAEDQAEAQEEREIRRAEIVSHCALTDPAYVRGFLTLWIFNILTEGKDLFFYTRLRRSILRRIQS